MLRYNNIIIIFLFASVFLYCTPPRYYRKNNNVNTYIHSPDNSDIGFQDFRFKDKDENIFYEKHESNIRYSTKKPGLYTSNAQKSRQNISQNTDIERKKNKIYKVQKGDNLLKISKKFCIPIEDITELNNIKNRNKIYAGMIIKIPDKKIQKTKNSNTKTNKNKENSPLFIWPIKDVYNAKRDGLNGVKSIGIIITGKEGTSVLSSADGTVTKVGYMRGFGNYVILKHINNYLTIYSNLKEIKVSEGDKIAKGKSIGNINGNKLHFQIGYSGKPEDPLSYLSKKS